MRGASAAIKLVGLADRSESHAGVLSGGERQRVAIARAMAVQPTVLLCDEPTGNLDSVNSALIVDLLLKLSRSGTTVILITHNAAIAEIGTRRMTLLDGVVHDG
jgi:putative ABC transport system ATP-binding protein